LLIAIIKTIKLPKHYNKYPNNCFVFAQVNSLAIHVKRIVQFD
jgi:hypothetical protein